MSYKKIIILVSALIIIALLFITLNIAPNRGGKLCEEFIINIEDSTEYQFVTKNDIVDIIKENHADFYGKTLSEISLHELELTLEKHQMLRNVDCYQSKSGKIVVDVHQRVPIFRVFTNDSSYYVDDKRVKMPIHYNHIIHVPVVTGIVKDEFVQNELFDFVLYLQNECEIGSMVQQIDVQNENRVQLSLNISSTTIIIGTLDDYKKKMNKLITFCHEVLPEVGWNKYKSINLEYKDKVVATKH